MANVGPNECRPYDKVYENWLKYKNSLPLNTSGLVSISHYIFMYFIRSFSGFRLNLYQYFYGEEELRLFCLNLSQTNDAISVQLYHQKIFSKT